jgi:hypothetical protein
VGDNSLNICQCWYWLKRLAVPLDFDFDLTSVLPEIETKQDDADRKNSGYICTCGIVDAVGVMRGKIGNIGFIPNLNDNRKAHQRLQTR